jgi:hypothetical protein
MKIKLSLSLILVVTFLSTSLLRAEVPKGASRSREEAVKKELKLLEDRMTRDLETLRTSDPVAYKAALERLEGKTDRAGAIAKLPPAEREKVEKAVEAMRKADETNNAAEREAARRAYFDTVSNVASSRKDISYGELIGVGTGTPKDLAATAASTNLFVAARAGKAGGSEFVPEASTSGRPKTHVTADTLKGKLDAALALVPKKSDETTSAAARLKETIDFLANSKQAGTRANVFEALNGVLSKTAERLKEIPEGPEKDEMLRNLEDILVRPILQAARKSVSAANVLF